MNAVCFMLKENMHPVVIVMRVHITDFNDRALPILILCQDAAKGLSLRPFLGRFNSLRMDGKKGSVAVIEYQLLEAATNNFRESYILGVGSSGRVYKTRFKEKSLAAVKRLDGAEQDAEREFENEVDWLNKIHHQNIISLLGYCIHGWKRFLVYEMMHNGSLETQLHQRRRRRRKMNFQTKNTPLDVPARKRFAKYRGLKSFRISSWDPKESLPPEYAIIFAFDNFMRTQKHILAKALDMEQGNRDDCIPAGLYARLHIREVPAGVVSKLCVLAKTMPVIVCGLLQHKSKMSVLHFSIKKHDIYNAPIKAKEELLFHVGFHQFVAR